MIRIKIYIVNEKDKTPYEYDGQLVPMINDIIEIPQRGSFKVKERIFEVNKANKIILVVKKYK